MVIMAMLMRFIILSVVRVVVVVFTMVMVTMRVGSIGGRTCTGIRGGSIVSSGSFVIYIIGILLTLCGDWSRLLPPLAPHRHVRGGDASHPTPPHALGVDAELVGNVRHALGEGGLHVREQCRRVGRSVEGCSEEHVASATREGIDVQPEGVGFVEGHRVASCWGRGGGCVGKGGGMVLV